MEIVRIASPTLEEFRAASDVCEIRWPHHRRLNTQGRFAAFQELKVELVAACRGGRFEGVCFILPSTLVVNGEPLQWVCPFQLATRPEAGNIGGLLFLRIGASYPAILSMGVTAEAKPFYSALRWKRYDDVWRGVHPAVAGRMIADYEVRVAQAWKRWGLRSVGHMYDLVAPMVDAGLALGVSAETARVSSPSDDSGPARKEGIIRRYLDVINAGGSLRCADVGGIGRVLTTFREGWGGLRQHARLWSELRQRGAGFCEVLIGSDAARRRAIALGYLPLRMPIYHVDRDGTIAKVLDALRSGHVSFLHVDKSV